MHTRDESFCQHCLPWIRDLATLYFFEERYLVEVSKKQRALLANALHLREVVVLQRTRAVRPEDKALQQLYRNVQRHEADLASCKRVSMS